MSVAAHAPSSGTRERRPGPPHPPACAHCSLPVPPGLVDPGAERQFCCAGCRAVHAAIRQHGLERFYDLVPAEEAAVPARTTGSDYGYLDDPAFADLHVRRTPAGHDAATLQLEGLRCAACVWMIEKLPRVAGGVVEARVDIGRQVVRLAWDPARTRLGSIARVLDSLGYPAHPYRDARAEEARRAVSRRMLVHVGVAGAIAGNAMLIAFALFGGMFDAMDDAYRRLFRWSGLGLTVLAVAWPGRTFLVGAWSSLRTRTMHMDVPVAVALCAGTLWGAANTVRGVGETYFESLTAVIFLLLVGRYLLWRRQRAAQDSVELLFNLTPRVARLIEPGGVREVPVEALEAGARVELLAGDSVPADGVLTAGRSAFDLSLLTGEPEPVVLGPGLGVHAGTVNLGARVEMEVESAGARTRLGRLMALVEEFARDRPPIVRLADRIAHGFVLSVLALAAVTAVAWMPFDPAAAFENAIAVLIVSCPCALGLATPLAVVAAIGRAARRGILIKGGEAVEALARPGTMVLDKTGTLTRGRTRLVHWSGDDGVRSAVRAIEARVAHPIASAFVEALAGDGPDLEPSEVRNVPGAGVEGRVRGRTVRIGSMSFVASGAASKPAAGRGELERETASKHVALERECVDRGLTPVLVSVDGEVVALAGFGDPLHGDSAEAVGALRRDGWRLSVVSGDHARVVRDVARAVGIDPEDAEGGASPERKAEIVRRRVRDGENVVMVGDGVNDTAALSAATVGVAVHGSAEASLAAAGVFLRRPGLGPLVELVTGSRRTVGVIRRNIGVSLLYNLVTASLAVTGTIDPLIAAVLMPISSIAVVTLSYRSRTF